MTRCNCTAKAILINKVNGDYIYFVINVDPDDNVLNELQITINQ